MWRDKGKLEILLVGRGSDFASIFPEKILLFLVLIPAEKDHLISGDRKPDGADLVGSFAIGLRSHRDFIIANITVKSGNNQHFQKVFYG